MRTLKRKEKKVYSPPKMKVVAVKQRLALMVDSGGYGGYWD